MASLSSGVVQQRFHRVVVAVNLRRLHQINTELTPTTTKIALTRCFNTHQDAILNFVESLKLILEAQLSVRWF